MAPPARPVTLATGASGAPATVSIEASELENVSYGAAGKKTVTVTAPTNVKGEASVTVA